MFVLIGEGFELGRADFAFGLVLLELADEGNDTGHLLGHHRLGVVEERILGRSAHRRGGQIHRYRAVEHSHQRVVEIALFGELKEGLLLSIALQCERAVLAHFHRVHVVGLEIAIVDHRLAGGCFSFYYILLS